MCWVKKNWNISNPISHLNRMIFKLSQDVFKHSNEILLSLVYGEMEMYTYLSTSCMTQYAIKFTKVRDMILRVYAFGKRIQLKLFFRGRQKKKIYLWAFITKYIYQFSIHCITIWFILVLLSLFCFLFFVLCFQKKIYFLNFLATFILMDH